MLHCKFCYYDYNVEFECVFLLCLEWDVMSKHIIVFSLENSFSIVLSGAV